MEMGISITEKERLICLACGCHYSCGLKKHGDICGDWSKLDQLLPCPGIVKRIINGVIDERNFDLLDFYKRNIIECWWCFRRPRTKKGYHNHFNVDFVRISDVCDLCSAYKEFVGQSNKNKYVNLYVDRRKKGDRLCFESFKCRNCLISYELLRSGWCHDGNLCEFCWNHLSRSERRTIHNNQQSKIKMEVAMSKNKVRFYRHEGAFCVETTHTDVVAFFNEASDALATMIEERWVKDEWNELLSHWLPQIMEIGSKLKGYKADVTVEQVTRAGVLPPTKDNAVWPKTVTQETVTS